MKLFILDSTAYDDFVEVLVTFRDDDETSPVLDAAKQPIPDQRFQIVYGDDATQLADLQAKATAHVRDKKIPPANSLVSGLTVDMPDVKGA